MSIVDTIGKHVALTPAGHNFKGLCPFHDEKTASFNVSPERNAFKCFGCGAQGDADTFGSAEGIVDAEPLGPASPSARP